MDPLLCHICNKKLERYKLLGAHMDNITYWECEEDIDVNDGELVPTGHCLIKTNPKRNGIVMSYSALIKDDKGYRYILDSDRDPPLSTITVECYEADPIYSISPIIKRFYPINLKEPLGPQFDKIYQKVKLCLTFS